MDQPEPTAPPRHYSIELASSRHEHDDVWSFHFRRLEHFDFRAGQYVHLKLDAPQIEQPVHHMSLASAPGDELLQFTMHVRPQSQFKLHLARMRPGDRASLFKIKGDFVLPQAEAETADRPCIFIANGIGITPFRSILRDAAQRGRELRAVLLHVDRGPWLFAEELALVAAGVQQCITSSELAPRLERSVREQPQARCYVAGSPSFVFAQRDRLLELGVAEENILLDNFKAYDELDTTPRAAPVAG